MDNDLISCVLIGENSLVIECGSILLKNKNWKIISVISDVDEVCRWARNNGLLTVSPSEMDKIRNVNADYLFSIVNYSIIPDHILSSVNKLAINYHDALLPVYAGVHATSWALSNGERRHGISWHVMSEKIDGGDILVQEKIAVHDYDTAESLNLKCFQSAIKGFEKLVFCIENNCLDFQKQDLNNRSYFGKWKKLHMDGLIDWDQRDKTIIRYVNSTVFGRYENAFLTAKIFLDGNFYIVDKIENYCGEFNENIGYAKIIDNKIVAAAKNRPLMFSVRKITGEEADLSGYSDEVFSLNPEGNVLDVLHKAVSDNLKSEKYWVEKIKNCKSQKIKGFDPCHGNESLSMELINSGANILEKILLFFYQRVKDNDINEYYIGFSGDMNEYSGICSDVVPFAVRNNKEASIEDIMAELKNELDEVRSKKTFLLDVFWRYPQIKEEQKYDYVLAFGGNECFFNNISKKLTIVIDKDLKKYKLLPYDDEGKRTASQITEILSKKG